MSVSRTRPGSYHDFRIFREGDPVDPSTQIVADSGYQGIQQLHPRSKIPYKRSKKRPLTPEERTYNRELSRKRIKVEHVFSDIKRFNIFSGRYRNSVKGYNNKFKIVAGIVNLRHGFCC